MSFVVINERFYLAIAFSTNQLMIMIHKAEVSEIFAVQK